MTDFREESEIAIERLRDLINKYQEKFDADYEMNNLGLLESKEAMPGIGKLFLKFLKDFNDLCSENENYF